LSEQPKNSFGNFDRLFRNGRADAWRGRASGSRVAEGAIGHGGFDEAGQQRDTNFCRAYSMRPLGEAKDAMFAGDVDARACKPMSRDGTTY